MTEQNRPDQNRTEQNRTEQNRTEQSRTEQNRTTNLLYFNNILRSKTEFHIIFHRGSTNIFSQM